MKRFKNILYLLDKDSLTDHVTSEKVASLVRLNDAHLTTIIRSERGLFESIGISLNPQQKRIHELMLEQNWADLSAFFHNDIWSELKITKDPEVFDGFIPIIQKVLRNSHDLVIVQEASERGVTQLAMRLVRKCPCPVWVIKNTTREFRRILAAVDVGSEYPETPALNQKIIELAHSLAQREHGEAHYLHVWRLEYETMLRGSRLNVRAEEVAEMKADLAGTRKTRLEQLLHDSKVHYDSEQFHVRQGSFVETVQRFISEKDIDVLVMGSVGRAGIPGFLIGNRAEELLQKIGCSVMTVKPDGFVSPVTIQDMI